MPRRNEQGGKSSVSLATALLIIGMLITGTANTVLTKVQDITCVENCSDESGKSKVFYEEPLWQTLQMFVGEFLCWLVFLISDRRTVLIQDVSNRPSGDGDEETKALLSSHAPADKSATGTDSSFLDDEQDDASSATNAVLTRQPLVGYRNFLLAIPTICDLTSTTLANVGLLFVSASIYQMLRGSVIVFTTILSMIFLGTRLNCSRFFGLIVVICGITVVGVSSFLKTADSSSSHESDNALMGTLLILCGQLFAAAQFVLEEKIISRYSATPMKLVGLEGVFGCVFVLIGMGIAHFSVGMHDPKSIFNFFRGWQNFISNPQIWISGICSAFSIGAFNWFGLNVTKFISATSRTTIDTCRTISIWAVCFIIGLEKQFHYIQLVGFVVLIYGTFVFNRIIPPFPSAVLCRKQQQQQQMR